MFIFPMFGTSYNKGVAGTPLHPSQSKSARYGATALLTIRPYGQPHTQTDALSLNRLPKQPLCEPLIVAPSLLTHRTDVNNCLANGPAKALPAIHLSIYSAKSVVSTTFPTVLSTAKRNPFRPLNLSPSRVESLSTALSTATPSLIPIPIHAWVLHQGCQYFPSTLVTPITVSSAILHVLTC